jgi:hypothetical protein
MNKLKTAEIKNLLFMFFPKLVMNGAYVIENTHKFNALS